MPLDDEEEELNQTVSEILSGMMSSDNKSSGYGAPNGFIDQKTSHEKSAAIKFVNESKLF